MYRSGAEGWQSRHGRRAKDTFVKTALAARRLQSVYWKHWGAIPVSPAPQRGLVAP